MLVFAAYGIILSCSFYSDSELIVIWFPDTLPNKTLTISHSPQELLSDKDNGIEEEKKDQLSPWYHFSLEMRERCSRMCIV